MERYIGVCRGVSLRETGGRALPGRGPAFLEKPGEKHQGETPWTPIFIMAPARTGYFCFRFRLFPLLSRYTGKVSDAITEGC